jgi:glutamate/tyrosine decarboxylase-like PLP-dependent enzyme
MIVPNAGGDMIDKGDKAALKFAAEAAIDWRDGVNSRQIEARDTYDDAIARFGGDFPPSGLPAEQTIRELVEIAVPGLCSYVHPRFLGWVVGGSDPVGVAADWVAQAWGQNAPISAVTPAAAAAEEVAGTWMIDALGLPSETGFGFTTGATMANVICLAAARNALLAREGWDVEADGLFGAPQIEVVVSAEAHASVFMALELLGFGAARVHKVSVDSQSRMLPDAFASVAQEISGPMLLVLQAGHINSGDYDPFEDIIPSARAKNAWIHVDAAFGIWVRLSEKRAERVRGVQLANSWAVDGHKWLQVPHDCGFAFVRDQDALTRAMSISGSYLAKSASRDPIATTPELSRRARGFAVWAILRHLGREGLEELVDRFCSVAEEIAERLATVPNIRVMNTVASNQLTFLVLRNGEPDDDLTLELLARLRAEGTCYPSDAVWKGNRIIRMSVCSGAVSRIDAALIAAAVATEVTNLAQM